MGDSDSESEGRRQHPRLEVTCAAQLENAERARLAVTRDVSRTGVRMLSSSPFAEGEVLDLLIAIRGSTDEYRLKAKVLRIKKLDVEGPMRWEIGLSFEEPLAEDHAILRQA